MLIDQLVVWWPGQGSAAEQHIIVWVLRGVICTMSIAAAAAGVVRGTVVGAIKGMQ